jgi:hypothetical protein
MWSLMVCAGSVTERSRIVDVVDDRVFVTLKRDESGYPPWDEEEIWAERQGVDSFCLDASPTFARGLSFRDVVHVVPVGDRWYVDFVVSSGGHSTVRVVLFDDDAHDRLLEVGRRSGCDVDHTEIPGLFAIDVAPSARMGDLVSLLEQGRSEGLWDVDEGNIAEGHSAR